MGLFTFSLESSFIFILYNSFLCFIAFFIPMVIQFLSLAFLRESLTFGKYRSRSEISFSYNILYISFTFGLSCKFICSFMSANSADKFCLNFSVFFFVNSLISGLSIVFFQLYVNNYEVTEVVSNV